VKDCADRLQGFQAVKAVGLSCNSIEYEYSYFCQRMGRIRLRVREFAAAKGWTLKEVATRAGVPYTTVATYANSAGMATIDYTALKKLARTFEVEVDDLVEVLEE
jgi:putative transcriptional regulator